MKTILTQEESVKLEEILGSELFATVKQYSEATHMSIPGAIRYALKDFMAVTGAVHMEKANKQKQAPTAYQRIVTAHPGASVVCINDLKPAS